MPAPTRSKFEGPVTVEQTRYGGDVLVVSLAGELDLASIDLVRSVLRPALAGPCGLVVIDLGDLEFLDASGVALLYGLAGVRADRDALRLLPSHQPAVNRILRMTDVADLISVVGF
jgi:anti-sigma B factor antagonist